MTTIALIGSFRKHYNTVLDVLDMFRKAGIIILTPLGTPIIKPGMPFVRFTSDPSQLEDYIVQTITMERIFRADLTYVVAPGGYVGRTTCYEIGRIIQAARPLYFTDYLQDLPIRIPESHILSPIELIENLKSGNLKLKSLFMDNRDEYSRIERSIIDG